MDEKKGSELPQVKLGVISSNQVKSILKKTPSMNLLCIRRPTTSALIICIQDHILIFFLKKNKNHSKT